MANSWQVVVFKVADKPANYLARKAAETTLGNKATGTLLGGFLKMRRLITHFDNVMRALASSVYHGNVWTAVFSGDGAFPAGNIACVQANAATDTVTFTFGTLAIVFTEAGTGAEGFARGADNTACAANLAAKINAHPVLSGIIKATPSAGNIALAGKIPTGLLHHVVLTTSDGTAFSFTQLTGGVPGTASIFPQNVPVAKTPV